MLSRVGYQVGRLCFSPSPSPSPGLVLSRLVLLPSPVVSSPVVSSRIMSISISCRACIASHRIASHRRAMSPLSHCRPTIHPDSCPHQLPSITYQLSCRARFDYGVMGKNGTVHCWVADGVHRSFTKYRSTREGIRADQNTYRMHVTQQKCEEGYTFRRWRNHIATLTGRGGTSCCRTGAENSILDAAVMYGVARIGRRAVVAREV